MQEQRFPAFSSRQPWVDLILMGIKDVENKSSRTHFRGTILIHASATIATREIVDKFVDQARKLKILGKKEQYNPDVGAILGMVDVVDCVETSESPFFEGPYGWVLANPRRFKKPIPYKGAVGIFYVNLDLLAGTPAARARPGSAP